MTPQSHAQFWIVKVNERSRKFLKLYEELVSDFHLLADEESVLPNSPDFKENRHDQSLLSMMAKANKPSLIPSYVEACFGKLGMQVPDGFADTFERHPTYGVPGLKVLVGHLNLDAHVQYRPGLSNDQSCMDDPKSCGAVDV